MRRLKYQLGCAICLLFLVFVLVDILIPLPYSALVMLCMAGAIFAITRKDD